MTSATVFTAAHGCNAHRSLFAEHLTFPALHNIMEFVQQLLTNAAAVIEGIIVLGLPVYAIARYHISQVKSWGTPQATPPAKKQLEAGFAANLTPNSLPSTRVRNFHQR